MIYRAVDVLGGILPDFPLRSPLTAIVSFSRALAGPLRCECAPRTDLLDDPCMTPSAQLIRVMTDMWTGRDTYDRLSVEDLNARLMWQQAACSAIAWQFDPQLCTYVEGDGARKQPRVWSGISRGGAVDEAGIRALYAEMKAHSRAYHDGIEHRRAAGSLTRGFVVDSVKNYCAWEMPNIYLRMASMADGRVMA